MARRVDNIPLLLRPFFWFYSLLLATVMYVLVALFRLTWRVRVHGREHLQAHPFVIECIWHETLPVYFGTHLRYPKARPYIWMNHPHWRMKPIHIMLRMMGVKHIILGSSGNNGQDALESMIEMLRADFNTLVATDGPAGPLRKVKYGVLEMSRKTGRPVVPIFYRCGAKIRIPGTWDRKWLAAPFAKLEIYYMPPIQVTHENYKTAGLQIAQALSQGPA
jgi:lysophospholipid acyltransferase (LPLAT)-like uncharacterized protein